MNDNTEKTAVREEGEDVMTLQDAYIENAMRVIVREFRKWKAAGKPHLR